MAKPKGITKEHINAALEYIEKNAIGSKNKSKTYFLEWNGSKYPVKYIVAVAREIKNYGEVKINPPVTSDFNSCDAYDILRKNGFDAKHNAKARFNGASGKSPAVQGKGVSGNKISVNTIFYGPPGTGKTYNTVIYAVAICENESVENIENEVKTAGYAQVYERYRNLIDEGRVVFTTFHQSYGYEDFIEGIKPEIVEQGAPGSTNTDVIYKTESGIFKEFCECRSFDEAWNAFMKDVRGNSGKIKIKTGRGNPTLTYDEKNDNLKNKEMGDQYADYDSVKGVYTGSFKKPTNSGSEERKYTYSLSIVKELIENYDLPENKVFIIDEINRGNVSKIFGELITLIEDDKRGKTYATLPYSKDPFTIPENVYILGTMNTADRSIALMDTALRRRFSFVEMMPDSSVFVREYEGEKIAKEAMAGKVRIKSLLDAINERIEYLYDREHTIGHAYFKAFIREDAGIDVLKEIFKDKILPLLQEYFYDDYEKISLVLGDGFVDSKARFVIEKDIPAALHRTVGDDKKYDLNLEIWGLDDKEFENRMIRVYEMGNQTDIA